jgi:hypothetical protein
MRTSPCSATPHRVIRTLVAAAPLAVLLGAAPVWAAPDVYYHAGAWHAFTDKGDQGAAICGIGTENTADGRSLSLTYTVGGSDLTITATKPNWNIPENTVLEADTQIDRNGPWQAQADGNGTSMTWVISASEIRSFDTEFRNGTTLTVTFPSGNEPPWSLALRGSTAASATLWRCVQDLTDRAKAAGAPPAGTQPSGQAVTQPFTPEAAPSNAPTNGTAAPAPPSATAAPTPSSANGSPANGSPANGSPANGSSANGSSASGAPTQQAAPANGAPAQAPASPAGGTPAPATKP